MSRLNSFRRALAKRRISGTLILGLSILALIVLFSTVGPFLVDPHNAQSAWIDLDLAALQVDANQPFQVHELISGARYTWHGARNYVQLNPQVVPAHIFRIRRKVRTERDFEYFL